MSRRLIRGSSWKQQCREGKGRETSGLGKGGNKAVTSGDTLGGVLNFLNVFISFWLCWVFIAVRAFL